MQAKNLQLSARALPTNPRYRIAGFYTHATLSKDAQWLPGAAEYFEKWAAKGFMTLERACQEKEIHYLGCFNCMGTPNPDIENFIKRNIIPQKYWQVYVLEIHKHPTVNDLHKAKEFTRERLKD